LAPFARFRPRASAASCAALACALLAPTGVHAQDVSAAGGRIAAEICAPCHDIGPRAGGAPWTKARGAAPSFSAIANAEGVNERALAVFLRTPHATMPDIILAPEEIEALAAFIMSRR
jgi:mono/diheme cytochrome c family protein